MILGLISDTHGLLRESALRAMRNTEIIIHAGDVGDPKILEALQNLAPVTAVRGNVDIGEWATKLPPTAVVKVAAVRIYVLHDVKQLKLNSIPPDVAIVVSGHSHKPGQTTHDGILYIDPGSAGPRRFKLPITVARLDLDRQPWEAEFIEVS
ncbi:MAG TPA: metallophosphoesterase family protein [Methylomirabilota bacterium]|jgi:putative phosphoesterase|nr:metallophosphoesterase family protein [Methylomirabilota bacterium]